MTKSMVDVAEFEIPLVLESYSSLVRLLFESAHINLYVWLL
jgi:hypothetical protein